MSGITEVLKQIEGIISTELNGFLIIAAVGIATVIISHLIRQEYTTICIKSDSEALRSIGYFIVSLLWSDF